MEFKDVVQMIEDLGSSYSEDTAKILKLLDESNQRVTELEKSANRPTWGGGEAKGMAALTRAVVDSPGWKSLQGGQRQSGRIALDLSIKQLVNLSGMLDTDGTGGLATLPTQLQGFYGAADATRRKRLFEVLPTRRVESNQVEHFELVDFSNAAAAQAGEGTAKAEQTFDPTPITRTIATIAAWTKASEQLLEDEMWVQGTLGSLLAGLVLDKAERLCVSGSGAGGEPLGLLDIVAVVANAQSNLADAVGAQADELSNDGYEPALALVNPLDWGTQRRERAESGDGQYVLGTPGAPAPPSLWGLTVIPSPAIPVNTVLMGDTRFAVIYDRRSVSVEAARSEDDFIKNLLTIRAEVRLAPDILDPLSWRQFSIAETS